MEKVKYRYQKIILLAMAVLFSFVGFSQDKVVNITISQPTAALTVSGTTTAATGFGLSNGSINITVNGGTPAYGYSWNNGATTQDINGLAAGTYTVTITDANSCTTSSSYTITQPALLTTSITVLNTLDCFGDNNGSLRADPVGGVSSYTYFWTRNGTAYSTTRTISGLTAANYVVLVTDSNGNTATRSYNLTQPSQIQYTVDATTNVSCFGDSTGAINISASGGTGGYTYQWSMVGNAGFSRTTQDISGLAQGQYTVTITDANSCSITSSPVITITQPATPITITSPTNGIQNPTFNGASDGSIDITVSGGTSGYTYSWSNGVTTQDITGLSDGTYTVTVTDANGCTTAQAFTLSEPPVFTVSISLLQPVLCNGDSTGSLLATAAGGIPNPGPSYNYEWFDMGSGSPISLGITTATINNLPAGSYRVIATDNNSNTVNDDFVLTEPSVFNFTSTTSSNVLCFGGNDGTASITVNGGTPGYTYSWTKTGDAGFSRNTASITNINAGEYNATVTDTNGCAINTSMTITEPATPVTISLTGITHVAIAGNTTGAIDISVSGGTPGYTYQWTKTGDAGFSETTQDLNNLGAGEYTISVQDTNSASTSNNGCVATQTFTVTEPAPLSVVITESAPILCFGDTNGELTATAVGGVGGYTYQWFEIISSTPNSLGITTPVITNLSPGEYQVDITDGNGATASDTYILVAPALLSATLTTTTDVLCFSESTGAIDITVSGGTAPYSYQWSDLNGSIGITTQDLSTIPSGDYSVIITDANSCQTTLGPISISEPASAMSITNATITNLLGFQTGDGNIDVTVTGGTPSYTYEWRLDGTTTIIGTTNILNNIQAGDYELTLIDSNGCTIVQVYTVTEPTLLEITSIDQTAQILCFGDTTAALLGNVQGGVSPYQYSWYNNSDATSILSTTSTVTNLGIGTYVLDITDANGIQTSANYTVTQPAELIATFTQTNVSCKGDSSGSIDISVSGGTGAYTYFWSNSANTQDVSGLIAGNYSVTIRDANLCETTLTIEITEPATILDISNVTIINTTGNGLSDGSIDVTAVGGTPTYTYEWRLNGTTTIIGTTNILSTILAGDYELTLIDSNGCTFTAVYTVNEPALLEITSIDETAPVLCFGDTNAALLGNVQGGVAPYVYSWYNSSDATTILSTTNTVSNLGIGTYVLDVTDTNGIQTSANYTVTQPNLLEITNIAVTNVSCYNGSDASIDVTVTGGTGSYIYSWSNSGSSTNVLTNVIAGDYDVTITDDNGCVVSSGTITVTQPPIYDITSVSLIRPSGVGVPDGSIAIDIIGGISPYDYVWTDQNGVTIQSNTNVTTTSDAINNLQEGTYTITITDANGCILTDAYNLADPGELLLSVTQNQFISCFGGSDGELQVNTIGGAGGNNFAWYNILDPTIIIGTTAILANVSAGSYYVIVSNADGIQEQSAAFEVIQPEAVLGSLSQVNPSCFNFNDGIITINASGGNGSYEYVYQVDGQGFSSNWIPFNNGATTELITLEEGFYEIRLRDTNGCFYEVSGSIGILSVTLVAPNELLISNATISEPTGFGLTNGSIDITISGGTTPYTYAWSDANGTLTETTNILSGIGAGTYTVLITDANGCQVQGTYTVTEPDALSVTIQEINSILCNQDASASIQATPAGGIAPYTYQWYNSNNNTTVIGTAQLIENLDVGSYYVIVQDANNNTIQSTTLTITEPDVLIVNLSADFVLCGDGNDWEIQTSVIGGTAPYTYLWNTGETTAILSNKLAGDYSVTVLDANGCEAQATISLIPPPTLETSVTTVDPTCFAGNDGSINVSVTGGTAPYTYLWSTSATTNSINNLTSGNYQLTITDAKGCEIIETYTIVDPEQLIIDLGSDVILCVNQSMFLDATITNGTNYQWTSDNGFTSTDAIIEVFEAGIYTIVVTDNLGCTATDDITVTNSDIVISAEFIMSTQVFTNENFVLVNVSEPFPEAVLWEFPPEAQVVNVNDNYAEIVFETAGEYDITIVTSLGGCMETQTKTVLVLEPEDLGNPTNNSNAPMIIDYNIFPNPASGGNFTLTVELREIQPISIKIYGVANNALFDFKTFEGENNYEISYNLNVPSGVYFVLLETPYVTQLKKVIVY